MRIAISNIAWEVSEDDQVGNLLHRYDIDAIDVAPGKYFPQPREATSSKIAAVRKAWADRGIQITGMQALLFGTSGLNLFGGSESQAAMLEHLDAVCRIASSLGATRLVFGSPKNRDRSSLPDTDALALSVDFFRRLGDIAGGHGVIVCLEPNPPCYGCNFMTNTDETVTVVSAVDHPAIRMQLDTGAVTINGEDPESAIAKSLHLIGHIHASEPDLLPLGEGRTDHGRFAAILQRRLPDHVVTIEMVATRNEPHLGAIERALRVANDHYRLQPIDFP